MSSEQKIKHIEMIQSIITRMGQNSFQIKAWSISLFTAVLIFLINQNSSNCTFFLLAVPAFGFLFLDAYYLWKERLFRRLYSFECGSEDTSWSMKTDKFHDLESFCSSLFSVTIFLFYFVQLATIIVVIYLTWDTYGNIRI